MYTFTLMQYSFLRCIYKYICVTRDNTYYICKIWHTIGFFSMHIGICMHTYTEEENAVYLWVMRSFHYGPNVDQQCHEILINRVLEASEPAIYLLVTKFLTIIANQRLSSVLHASVSVRLSVSLPPVVCQLLCCRPSSFNVNASGLWKPRKPRDTWSNYQLIESHSLRFIISFFHL